MKFKPLVLALALFLAVPACAPKNVTPETPRAASAITADQIVIRVNELQAAVIQACGPARTCAPGTIDTAVADEIVRACIDLRQVLRSVPDGWQAATRATWTRVKPRLNTNDVVITAAINAVDALIGGL